MKDELISEKTAISAKEKKLNLHCQDVYTPDGFLNHKDVCIDWNLAVYKFASAPTQSLLQRWLREEHNINVFVKVYAEKPNKVKYLGCVLIFDESISGGGYEWTTPVAAYEKYEDAMEEALMKGLEILK